MSSRNLRHLRVFLAVFETGSVTRAAARCSVSQPAVTQALAKLEREAGGALFDRTRRGFFPTGRARVFGERIRRAIGLIDAACAEIAPRLGRVATSAQLRALIAVNEAENVTLAARQIGLAQPTVHRAISQLEREAGRPLFDRTSYGMVATRACRSLAQAARLALAELEQADADLAELDGREVGRIVVGALPLSRSVLLPRAVAAFRKRRPGLPIRIVDGVYGELLAGLRRGDIDLILGALRDPAPIGDVLQEPLFEDRVTVLCGPSHPLANRERVAVADLAGYGWVVPRAGTPTRAHFDAFAATWPGGPPESIIEAGSILFMREILNLGSHLGCISGLQARAEIANGLVVPVNLPTDWPSRSIGMTCRADWVPTRAQSEFLEMIRRAAEEAASS